MPVAGRDQIMVYETTVNLHCHDGYPQAAESNVRSEAQDEAEWKSDAPVSDQGLLGTLGMQLEGDD